MSTRSDPGPSIVAAGLYGLLNPVPYGCFTAACVFDLLYAETAEMLWNKGAAWLILFGLFFAIVPRLVNLVQVWMTSRPLATGAHRLDFWVNLVAIAVAIVNTFVHTRDAYGVVPAGLWLSALTVLLMAVGRVASSVSDARAWRLPS